jgi:hypothetical protein
MLLQNVIDRALPRAINCLMNLLGDPKNGIVQPMDFLSHPANFVIGAMRFFEMRNETTGGWYPRTACRIKIVPAAEQLRTTEFQRSKVAPVKPDYRKRAKPPLFRWEVSKVWKEHY